MEFDELTKAEKDYFKKVYWDNKISWNDKMGVLSAFIGKSGRTVRTWAKRLKLTNRESGEAPELKKAKGRKHNKKTTKFLITWAQNNTPVHLKFFSNMKAYAKKIDADIHVMAGRYRNPTSIFNDELDRWSGMVIPHLDAARHDIHKYMSIMSDVKTQPTAVNPMTGMQSMSDHNSCIFGSPKIQMQTIPVLEKSKPKMILTSGACTVKNYTDSKAGKKGEFHHSLGFCIVEIKDNETFYVRQVSADSNGDFKDLFYDVKFEGKEVPIEFDEPKDKMNWVEYHCGAKPVRLDGEHIISKNKGIEACVWGDLHYGQHDPEVISATHSMLDIIKPKHVVLHDVFDGYSISHHAMKDPFVQYGNEVHGTNDLKKEIDDMMEGLESFNKYDNVVIVRSNHDDFLDRWVKNSDWKKQPTYKNSPEYMEYSSILLKQHAETPDNVKGIIPELINRKYPKFKTLGRRDSYVVKDYQLGLHGDSGTNGSRGSLMQFRKLSTKIVVGHYHSPGRLDGALAVGTSTKLRLSYNIGPSSWLNSHVIIHENGKAQHVNFMRDKYGKIGYTTMG